MNSFIEIGQRVEFTSDIENRRLTGLLGTSVRHKLNGVGWSISVIELDTGGFVDLYWSKRSCWKYSDVPKPKPQPKPPRKRKISLSWAWCDLWVGVSVETDSRTLYICPLPTMLVTIKY